VELDAFLPVAIELLAVPSTADRPEQLRRVVESVVDNALLKLVNTVTRLLTNYPVATEEVWRTTMSLARVDTPNRAFNHHVDAAHHADDSGQIGRDFHDLLKAKAQPACPARCN
jgi:hypothetical protein